MDDTKIILLYQNRSELAIEQTARKYGSYLNQIAQRILRCPEDTEEILEDTYYTAWNTIPPEAPRVLKHYLSRITRNLAFNRLDYLGAKRRDNNMILLLSELDACIPDNRSDMDALLESRLAGEIINHFLSQLEQLDCAIFLCRYYHCMTIQEIAEKYDQTERHIKYRLSRMRQQLRRELEKEGICV